ncbi:MAG: hypothetical protein U0234_08100 [Sandaracinus sp.]
MRMHTVLVVLGLIVLGSVSAAPVRADVMPECPPGTHAVRTPPPPGQHLGTYACVQDGAPPPTPPPSTPASEAPAPPPPSSAAPPPPASETPAPASETPAPASSGCAAVPGSSASTAALFGWALVLGLVTRRRSRCA